MPEEKSGGMGGQAKCEQCGMSFNNQNELQQHNRSAHTGGGESMGGEKGGEKGGGGVS
jgi:hypothetical protein